MEIQYALSLVHVPVHVSFKQNGMHVMSLELNFTIKKKYLHFAPS